MSDLDTKLNEVARQYDDLQSELARPETSTDPSALRRLGKEMARLEPVVAAFRRLQATRSELAGARELRDAAGAAAPGGALAAGLRPVGDVVGRRGPGGDPGWRLHAGAVTRAAVATPFFTCWHQPAHHR